MTTDTIVDTVSGIVGLSNEYGFQLEGGDFLILSKYAKPAPLLPRKGMHVDVGLDNRGFVRSVHEVREEPTEQHGRAGELLYLPDVQRSPELGAMAPKREQVFPPDKDTRIGRMAALNTAVAVLSSGGQRCVERDVLALAGRLEAWVSR